MESGINNEASNLETGLRQTDPQIKSYLQNSISTLDRGNNRDYGFPREYFDSSLIDEKTELLKNWTKSINDGNIPAKLPKEITAKSIETLTKYDNAYQLFQFDQFLDCLFDVGNTTELHDLLMEQYPDYYHRREAYINNRVKFDKKLAKIKLHGVRSRKDLFFLFHLYNGDSAFIPVTPVFTTIVDPNMKEKWLYAHSRVRHGPGAFNGNFRVADSEYPNRKLLNIRGRINSETIMVNNWGGLAPVFANVANSSSGKPQRIEYLKNMLNLV